MKVIRRSTAQQFTTPNAIVTPIATRRTGSEQLSVIHQKMESGQSNPKHTQTTEEVMVMLSGYVDLVVGDQEVSLAAGDAIIVPACVPHAIVNSSGSSAEWLIVSPAGMQFHGPAGKAMTPAWAE